MNGEQPETRIPTVTEQDEALEVAAIDRPPFAQLPDWVALAGITCQAQALYWHLAMHVNVARGDGMARPSKDELARRIGIKDPRKINRYLDELEGISALQVERQHYMGGMRARNRYYLRFEPPADHEGPRSNAEHYRRLKSSGGAPQGTTGTTRENAQDSRSAQWCPTGHPGGAPQGTGTRPRGNKTKNHPPYPPR